MYCKPLLSAVAIAVTFVAFIPYIRSVLAGITRPHVFTWIIWGITTSIVFFAQLAGLAGAGAWPVGFSAAVTLFIALLAFLRRSDISITASDWLFFTAAMSSLPFWYLTSDPLWAVVILTTVDVLGFGPTVRKAWQLPHTESLLFFVLFAFRNLLVLLALEHYSATTVLFPAVIAGVCMLFTAMVLYRRRVQPA